MASTHTSAIALPSRRFELHTSSFLRDITINGPESYRGTIGHGSSGAIVLHPATDSHAVAGAVHFQKDVAQLRAGDPADSSTPGVDASHDSRGAPYSFSMDGRALVFYRQGWKTRSRFYLVDTARRALLAEFEPGSGRNHVLQVYEAEPRLEMYVLLLAAMIAAQVQRAPMGPSLWSMEREIEAAQERNAMYGSYAHSGQVSEPWLEAKEMAA